MAFDLLIKNGRVVDGSGEPAFQADVAVKDGKIVGVGKSNGAAAERTIDAGGRVVAPGFIDHHTHFDPQAVWDPYCGSWVHNGHTTVIVGQCGQVIAPVRPGDSEWYLEFFSDAEQIPLPVLKAGVDVTWESVGDYLNALGKRRGINVGTLVGHSGIRRYVMGEAASERVQATPEELATMQKLIREAMYDGALGFSTAPKDRGLNVPQDEDITHPEGFFRGMPTWDKVMALPYQDRMRALRDPEIRRAMSAEAVEGTVAQEGGMTDRRGRARGLFNRRWDLVEVFMTAKGQNRHLEGKSVEKIAQEQNKGVMDAFLDLSLDEDLQTCFQAIDRNHDPKVQKHILGSPYTVIGTSDGGGRPHTADRHETSTNLLGHWVREQQAMTLEEAGYRLTGKTALMHDITDRGFIAAGKVADITIFDPDTIASKPREPVATLPGGGVQVRRDAVGIDHVIVNGAVLLEGGELTDALPGQIIRGPLYQA